jgi:phospholipid/cholesterol/gamma-HCH transport system substrate-binding protein
MRRGREIAVGLFLLLGLFCLGYMAFHTGELSFLQPPSYRIRARFDSAEGLVARASVEIAGVPVGHVRRITLVDYRAEVELDLDKSVQLQDDAIASIRQKGIIGETFILITPGGSPRIVPPGGRLRQTESAVDLQQLISTYIHGRI